LAKKKKGKKKEGTYINNVQPNYEIKKWCELLDSYFAMVD
jgi:hypothetical protein